ncbi:MAG: folylpolyglutamate synthase/dihydrofolate synthase family protein [Bacteroidota bacterium]|nr:bifunctional folylpolyglutamate synthase/dihydrofolate synthase [Candidatus Kapabacteria bacterium]MDW8220728.1 folylpolyglutamate synthase/dihydrofolate synthase family protein [Bacteroidota bacterium]
MKHPTTTALETSSAALQDILEELYTLRRFHATPGLHRIRSILYKLGNPHKRFPSIHIAGTNGKGTVSSILASVLREAGYKVGLYTSPHIIRFNERIRLNGQEIPDDILLATIRHTMPLILSTHATFFEAATALALYYFAENNVDIAVIETGLGGRLDATNVLEAENVLATAITSIDYDHTEYLGDTLEQIAAEKAGIMKHSNPCIVAEPRSSLRSTFEYHAQQAGALLHFLDEGYRVDVQSYTADCTMRLTLHTPHRTIRSLHSRLCGSHQARNILTAYAVLDYIHRDFPTSTTQFRHGLERLYKNSGLRGRIELLRKRPPCILDVAHNPAGVRMLIQTLRNCGYTDTRWHVVFAAMQDKQVHEMLRALQPIVQRLHIPTLNLARALQPTAISHMASSLNIPTTIYDSAADACDALVSSNDPLLVVGSFHLAEEVLQWYACSKKD